MVITYSSFCLLYKKYNENSIGYNNSLIYVISNMFTNIKISEQYRYTIYVYINQIIYRHMHIYSHCISIWSRILCKYLYCNIGISAQILCKYVTLYKNYFYITASCLLGKNRVAMLENFSKNNWRMTDIGR